MALSQQTDTTKICFTKIQVQTFLKTKVELVNATQTVLLLEKDIVTTKELNDVLNASLVAQKRKLKRTRTVAGVGIAGTVLFALITFIK
jgi:DNA topoisomerase VI subunit B